MSHHQEDFSLVRSHQISFQISIWLYCTEKPENIYFKKFELFIHFFKQFDTRKNNYIECEKMDITTSSCSIGMCLQRSPAASPCQHIFVWGGKQHLLCYLRCDYGWGNLSSVSKLQRFSELISLALDSY